MPLTLNNVEHQQQLKIKSDPRFFSLLINQKLGKGLEMWMKTCRDSLRLSQLFMFLELFAAPAMIDSGRCKCLLLPK